MRILALLTACLLASCAGLDPEVAAGPYYTQGYTDGCNTAGARQSSFNTETFRDAFLYQTEDSYGAGWRAGFAECNDQGIPGAEPPTNEGLLSEPF